VNAYYHVDLSPVSPLIEGQIHYESFVVHFVVRVLFFYSLLIWTERYNLVAVATLYQAAELRCSKPGSDRIQ
jgi:hypothetical protein